MNHSVTIEKLDAGAYNVHFVVSDGQRQIDKSSEQFRTLADALRFVETLDATGLAVEQ